MDQKLDPANLSLSNPTQQIIEISPFLKMSKNQDKFAPAFLRAQRLIQPIGKSGFNPQFKNAHNPQGSRHSKFEDVAAEIIPKLNSEGISASYPASYQLGAQAIHVDLLLVHCDSGQFRYYSMILPITKVDAQGAGGGITYGKRYITLAAMGTPEKDSDDDGASVSTGQDAGGHKDSVSQFHAVGAAAIQQYVGQPTAGGQPITTLTGRPSKSITEKQVFRARAIGKKNNWYPGDIDALATTLYGTGVAGVTMDNYEAFCNIIEQNQPDVIKDLRAERSGPPPISDAGYIDEIPFGS